MFFRSLKKEILVFNLGLTIVTIIAMTAIGAFSTQTAGEDAAGTTSDVLQQQAKEFLIQITTVATEQQDFLFERIRNDTDNVASYTKNIYENPAIFSHSGYWEFDTRVFQKNGRYLNDTSDLSTVHIPSFVILDEIEKRNIELSAFLDLVVPGILRNNQDAVAVYTIDTKGVTRYFPNIVLGNLAPPDYDPREDIYYKPATPRENPDKKVVWSALYDDVAGRGLMITATAPIYTKKGFEGIASTDMLLTNIIKNITAYSPVEESYAFLVDEEGNTIAFPNKAYEDILGRPRKEGETRTSLASSSQEFLPLLKEMTNGTKGFGSIHNGEKELLMAYAPLKQTGFSMAIVVEKAIMLKAVRALHTEISTSIRNTIATRILPASLFIILFASFFSIFLVNRIARPIQELTKGVREIGGGNLDYNLKLESKNEIGILASSFNQMSHTLKKSREELEEYSKGLEGKVKERTKELQTANKKLRELDRVKTEFVSLATHQLRSPLTAIKGYASMVLENSFGEVGEKARGAVNVIFQSSQKLVEVIEDFLNITRIELGTMKYDRSELNFKELVENVSKELKVNVEKKGLQFSLETDPAGDYKLVGDSGKLAQVVGNLIDNAIKYTPRGAIKVTLRPVAGKIRLEVSDTGVGIPAEIIPKLFQKFTRAEDAGKVNITGTGLGLYVAKQIVEAHQGKIWAESDGTGRGSRFIVELETKKIPA